MPLYDYKCTVCGAIHEEIRKVENRNIDTACYECFNISKKVLTSPAGIQANNHDGYRHRTGSKGIWKTDMGPQGELGKEWYGDNPHASSTLAKT